ncbi:hypothetical protein FY528_07245 [Hymenobacter lutimineralis]|uniref:Uncharacterized protein n=1 Tax=Hymenobacter lutimineralis TaxID=2606448 RepID=A0A5D6V826_9BACT|nr:MULTISPECIES: hypothetical protein [Hymenobacter]QIX61511.1 hypothetical protein HER32_10120 [Hymenobacter sp. BT18]TYZ11480.1 hypothetical protein FY528_07245 [Hymenobacter lutimineralis]
MKELGLGLLIIGLVSMLLPFLGMKFMFLTWIDQWGPTTAWVIRGGATLLGLVLWLSFKNRD